MADNITEQRESADRKPESSAPGKPDNKPDLRQRAAAFLQKIRDRAPQGGRKELQVLAESGSGPIDNKPETVDPAERLEQISKSFERILIDNSESLARNLVHFAFNAKEEGWTKNEVAQSIKAVEGRRGNFCIAETSAIDSFVRPTTSQTLARKAYEDKSAAKADAEDQRFTGLPEAEQERIRTQKENERRQSEDRFSKWKTNSKSNPDNPPKVQAALENAYGKKGDNHLADTIAEIAEMTNINGLTAADIWHGADQFSRNHGEHLRLGRVESLKPKQTVPPVSEIPKAV